MSPAPSRWRLLLRVASVLCLLLAALVLAADHQEYRQLTRAGMRALLEGVLPLVVTALVSLRAQRGDGSWPGIAFFADFILLVRALQHLSRGSQPPMWPMIAAVATAMLLGAAGNWYVSAREAQRAAREEIFGRR